MSRIGKKQLIIPSNVDILLDNNNIIIKGVFGTLKKEYNNKYIFILQKNNILNILLLNKNYKSYYGLIRNLIKNMIIGVSLKFKKILYLEGIGYKFTLLNNNLILNINLSHPIILNIPFDIKIELKSFNRISIESIDNEKLGLFSSKIHNLFPPEPYKGKGIFYENEKIIRKIGKKSK